LQAHKTHKKKSFNLTQGVFGTPSLHCIKDQMKANHNLNETKQQGNQKLEIYVSAATDLAVWPSEQCKYPTYIIR